MSSYYTFRSARPSASAFSLRLSATGTNLSSGGPPEALRAFEALHKQERRLHTTIMINNTGVYRIQPILTLLTSCA